MFARADPCLGRRAGNIFSVFIRAGKKGHVVTLHALETGNGVRNQSGVSGADVGTRVGVVNRRGQIELRAIVGVGHGRSEPGC